MPGRERCARGGRTQRAGALRGLRHPSASQPEAAADELQRCVEELGFKGAMMFGLTDGKFLDETPFWPIYARAAKLKVPVYLHPSMPHPIGARGIYYSTYARSRIRRSSAPHGASASKPARSGSAWS
jgi:predicted TIM-barrel fold metal-dependent hydrolase